MSLCCVVMLTVIMLTVVRLTVVMLSVIMLSVMPPIGLVQCVYEKHMSHGLSQIYY
jgi:hypothetical protein